MAGAPCSSAPNVLPGPQLNLVPPDYEYDFVEGPPEDFFCPVSLQLLRNPHQTDCCGKHIERDIAAQLQRSAMPCPMCKHPGFTSRKDKYHMRNICALLVRCLHNTRGCSWEGELGYLEDHAGKCPKQPWLCPYCGTEGLKEEETKHLRDCIQFPTPCPNSCEVGAVPRCLLRQHALQCSLEAVDCEYADSGCPARPLRRDLGQHMKQSEQFHLLKMCALNVRLNRELVARVSNSDHQIARLQDKVEALELQLRELGSEQEAAAEEVSAVTTKVEKLQVTNKQLVGGLGQVTETVTEIRTALWGIQHQLCCVACPIPPVVFTVTNFTGLSQSNQEWRSPPFYSHHRGYKMCLGVFPNGLNTGGKTHVSIRFYKMHDFNSSELDWSCCLSITIQTLNQLTREWEVEYKDEAVRSPPSKECESSKACPHYLPHSRLCPYLKNDQLSIRVTEFKVIAKA